MNLVIPYTNDQRGGHELKYAIRSMQKHFKDLNGVLLIGDPPAWYTGDYMPASDKPGRKEFSIVSKILQCPYDNFLLSSDDIFAQADFDETIPRYYSTTLMKAAVYGKYVHRRDNTARIYPDGMMYDCHKPMVINLELYRQAHDIPWKEREYLNKSIYGNFVASAHGGGVQLDDYKIRTREVIDPSAPFFSTNERTAKFVRFEDMWPTPSKYEKT